MERRELLKGGLRVGALIIGERLLETDPAEAVPAVAPARFFNGTLNGGAVSYWTLWVSISGKRARGFAFDPDTTDGSEDPQGFRLNGRFSGDKLTFTLYDIADVNETTPVGTLTAKQQQLTIRGTFTLSDSSDTGDVVLSPVLADKSATAAVSGTYRGRVEDGQGNLLYSGQLKLRANGTYVVTDISQPGTGGAAPEGGAPSPTRLSGQFALVIGHQVWLSPTPVAIDPSAACFSDPLACVPVLKSKATVHGASFSVEHPFRGCVVSGKHR